MGLSETLSSVSSRAISTVVSSFSSDPVNRWLYPEPDASLRHFPNFVEHLGGGAFASGGAYHADAFVGAAMWLPPGGYPDDRELEALFAASLSERLARTPPNRPSATHP